MSRARPGFYNTIEYIGARPQKQKRRHFSGGWVIIAISLVLAGWFGRPLVPFLKAAQVGGSVERAAQLISSLEKSKSFGDSLAAAALAQSGDSVTFDSTYYKIAYPNGDIPANRGDAADVVVRCFRKMGIDLQVLVHEDMVKSFRLYPQLWGSTAPDPNIDHRRVANLQRFFEHKGQSITPSRNAADYRSGDIVVWSLANAEVHIGIIVPGPGDHAKEAWVVHNIGAGMKWENVLFENRIQRHFRYPAEEAE